MRTEAKATGCIPFSCAETAGVSGKSGKCQWYISRKAMNEQDKQYLQKKPFRLQTSTDSTC